MEMSEMEKERTIRRNLDFLLLEFPGYVKRLEGLECNFDANVGWKEFKFCFKLGTGQIVSGNLIFLDLIFIPRLSLSLPERSNLEAGGA